MSFDEAQRCSFKSESGSLSSEIDPIEFALSALRTLSNVIFIAVWNIKSRVGKFCYVIYSHFLYKANFIYYPNFFTFAVRIIWTVGPFQNGWKTFNDNRRWYFKGFVRSVILSWIQRWCMSGSGENFSRFSNGMFFSSYFFHLI